MELEAAYLAHRPLLLSLAYRMLGSVSDAEDLVQDVYVLARKDAAGGERGNHLADSGHEHEEMRKEVRNRIRTERLDGKQEKQRNESVGEIRNAKAYLCRMVTNRALDLLKSARKKRELYVGPWLPEPVVQAASIGAGEDPLERIVLEDSISYAFLVMLDRLTPVERAVFLLRDSFEYGYRDIAEMLGKTELGCRQIHSRLKKKLRREPEASAGGEADGRTLGENGDAEKIVRLFLHATGTGDLEALLALMKKDIALYSDGGGKVSAATRPIRTPEHVAAFLFGLVAKFAARSRMVPARVNGETGLLILGPDGDRTVVGIHVEDGLVQNVYLVRNPDKLRHVRP